MSILTIPRYRQSAFPCSEQGIQIQFFCGLPSAHCPQTLTSLCVQKIWSAVLDMGWLGYGIKGYDYWWGWAYFQMFFFFFCELLVAILCLFYLMILLICGGSLYIFNMNLLAGKDLLPGCSLSFRGNGRFVCFS